MNTNGLIFHGLILLIGFCFGGFIGLGCCAVISLLLILAAV